MSNFYNPPPDTVFLHGTYVGPESTPRGDDACIVATKDLKTGESVLKVIKNPLTQVYVQKEGLRTFKHKREYEKYSSCDMLVTPYRDQYAMIADALKIRNRDPFFMKREVEASPFAYTWDIHPLIRMKCEYLEKTQRVATNLNIGILDIETSVQSDAQILCISICNWTTREVHCLILNDEWLRAKDTKGLEERVAKEYPGFVDGLNDKARKLWDEKPITPVFHLCHDEKDVIVETFQYIHSCKFDFIGVWNIGYDAHYIVQRAEFRQLNLNDLFCHPEVPEQFRVFKWKEDKTQVDHFTDVWHVVQAPGYAYWYDAMCLYSRLRKVKGRDVFYTLDYIGNKIIGSGKMHFGANENHYLMQTKDQIGYCVYNTLDVVIPALMDAITHDVATMIQLADCSMLTDFAKQTVQLKAQFYKYLKQRGCVPGSVAGSTKQEYDEVIGNIGGAVLNPALMKVKGLACLVESNLRTFIYRLVADLDVSSFYPSVTVAFNVSRETKIASVLWFEGCPYTIEQIQKEKVAKNQKAMAKANAEYINMLFGRIPCVKENAVAILNEHFNLPDYQEMLQLITDENYQVATIPTGCDENKCELDSIGDN